MTMAAYDYTHNSLDLSVTIDGSLFPDISTVGMEGYPAEFAMMMPGYTGKGHNVAGQIVDGVPGASDYFAGDWSAPEAYAWHRADNLTTNPQIGGLPGDGYGTPFAFGPVESNTVENFEMLGNQAVFQTPDVTSYGEVGFMDFGGRLASAVSSQTYDLPSYYDSAAAILGGL